MRVRETFIASLADRMPEVVSTMAREATGEAWILLLADQHFGAPLARFVSEVLAIFNTRAMRVPAG